MLDLVVTNWAWLVLALIAGSAAGYLSIRAHAGRRRAAEAKAAEDARRAAEAKAAEDARRAAEAKAAEDARRAAEAKAAEDARRAAEAKAAEDARRAAEAKATEDARRAAEAKAAEDARRAAEAKAAEEAGIATTAHPGTRPKGIAAPPMNQTDDLKLIKGIGPKNEKICNDLGVYQFSQIADWTPDEAVWVGHHIAFPGRIEREYWIPQAQLLATGGETEHSTGVKSGTIKIDASADAPLVDAEVRKLGDSLPRQAAGVEGEGRHDGRRPYGLAAPRGGAPDDLKRIRGIGPQNEGRLHALGIWHFGQIAAWSAENAKWIGSYLAFRGRIERERWTDQAKELAAGSNTKFLPGANVRKIATPKDRSRPAQG
jgi:predicted flap endonuclease-1-like 5' DNA nuclease